MLDIPMYILTISPSSCITLWPTRKNRLQPRRIVMKSLAKVMILTLMTVLTLAESGCKTSRDAVRADYDQQIREGTANNVDYYRRNRM